MPYYSEKFGCQLLCKRDDLFAEAGSGSKARMLQYILADVNRQNCDVLVTAGGPCSNFNRACALMCAKIGVSMHLVEYTDNPDEFQSSLNYFLCKLAGITRTRCKKDNVPVTFIAVNSRYRGNGIASHLLDIACDHAKKRGMDYMGIETNNIVAKECYIKKQL